MLDSIDVFYFIFANLVVFEGYYVDLCNIVNLIATRKHRNRLSINYNNQILVFLHINYPDYSIMLNLIVTNIIIILLISFRDECILFIYDQHLRFQIDRFLSFIIKIKRGTDVDETMVLFD